MAGQQAAQEMLKRAKAAQEGEMVLCLISGGGSALLCLPIVQLTLAEKQTIHRDLLQSGATIAEINCVRKHLSQVKGGRLGLAAFPATVVTLAISDVPGDDLSLIASGPTVPDVSTSQEALIIIEKYGISVKDSIKQYLCNPESETPKPNQQEFENQAVHLIAAPQQALEAAAQKSAEQGIPALILSNDMEGEAKDVALVHASIARQIVQHQQPAPYPCVLLSGGEATVTVKGSGKGGTQYGVCSCFDAST